jgi:hypothetical protein
MGRIVERIGDDAALAGVELDGCEMADLVAELLSRGASARFVARGGSMSPWIRDGDVVTVEPLAAAVGDVAAFRLPGGGRRLRVHRLVRRVAPGWLAQGDRQVRADGVIPDSEILGVVRRIERRGRSRYLPSGATAVWLARLSRLALEARAWAIALAARR